MLDNPVAFVKDEIEIFEFFIIKLITYSPRVASISQNATLSPLPAKASTMLVPITSDSGYNYSSLHIVISFYIQSI